jgi:ferritin-like metal-binding protein YciE
MAIAPPSIDSASDLLLAELGKLLTIEETLLKRVLPRLVHDVQDEQLQAALADHVNAYEAAIRVADALGAEEVGGLLRANLEQEVTALERLGREADRLAQRA